VANKNTKATNEPASNMGRQNIGEKLQVEATRIGLTLIGPGKDKSYRTYRFNECGHEQEIGTGSVRKRQFKCRQCLTKTLEDEARAADLTLLGPGKNRAVRTYRFNECGHEQQIHTGAVRQCYGFVCNSCEETSRALPSNMYLLKIKVGATES